MNLYVMLADAVRRYPQAVALESDERRLSYARLDAATAAVAAYYARLGCRQGDRVLIYLANSIDYPVLLLGAIRAGLVAVPINAKLLPHEAAWICNDAEARVAIVHRNQAEAVKAELTAGAVVLAVEDIDFAALPTSAEPAADVAPDDLAWLFYTSGTTGKPKGAMLNHRNLIAASVNCLADMVDFRADDRVLHVAPLSHASGIYLIPSLARGAVNRIASPGRFDPEAVLDQVARERISVIAFVAPTMIVRLLAAPERDDLGALRAVVYGGAAIHLDHIRAAVARFGPVFRQLYGQGEAPMTISGLSAEAHGDADDATLRSAGFVRSGVEVRIDGTDEGEICVRGDVVMQGYWRNPGATARALQGGWLHTGDIGRFDEAGRLHVLDRSDDTIISGGTNIYPKEVEDAVAAHPAVREVIAFGLPDAEWGQCVAVAVVAPGLDEAELRAFCVARIAGFKRPKRVLFLDALPQSAYGKVLRRELRIRFANPQENPT
jgi:acyl-CoA synthetase (AMP-forming)/AMP-acid ligase II